MVKLPRRGGVICPEQAGEARDRLGDTSVTYVHTYKSLDLQLSKDIKNSLLSCIVLPIEAAEEAKVIDNKFHRQKIKIFQFLSYKNVMYLKRKLRTCTIQILLEKV